MKRWPMAVVGLVGMLGLLAGPVQAAEITVLGGMGVVSGLHDLAPAFEKMTGHKVIVRFVQTADINQKINSGAPADIAALQPQQVDAFIKDGKMVAGTKTNFVQAGVGVAVKTGARTPDISTCSCEAYERPSPRSRRLHQDWRRRLCPTSSRLS